MPDETRPPVRHARENHATSARPPERHDGAEHYRQIVENVPAAAFVIDEQSHILFANLAAAQLFGYTAEELLRGKITMLMPEGWRARHRAGLARYCATGRRGVPWEGWELVGQHRDGHPIALEVSFAEFFDHEQRRRFVGVARDMSLRKQAQQELAALSRRLLQVQETERRHIAHELHDAVGQALTALKITLHTAQQLAPGAPAAVVQDALGQVDRIVQQLRALALELRPPMLDDLGLMAALRWYVKGVAQRSGLAIHLEVAPGTTRFPAELEMACFRIVQEALNNVVKHAQASQVRVALRQQDGTLHLTVRDDGVGFDPAAARQRASRGFSLGLLGMEERAQLLGGQFEIHSAPGQGTEVRAQLPLGAGAAYAEPGEETR